MYKYCYSNEGAIYAKRLLLNVFLIFLGQLSAEMFSVA